MLSELLGQGSETLIVLNGVLSACAGLADPVLWSSRILFIVHLLCRRPVIQSGLPANAHGVQSERLIVLVRHIAPRLNVLYGRLSGPPSACAGAAVPIAWSSRILSIVHLLPLGYRRGVHSAGL
jgi:hypothetical protein